MKSRRSVVTLDQIEEQLAILRPGNCEGYEHMGLSTLTRVKVPQSQMGYPFDATEEAMPWLEIKLDELERSIKLQDRYLVLCC